MLQACRFVQQSRRLPRGACGPIVALPQHSCVRMSSTASPGAPEQATAPSSTSTASSTAPIELRGFQRDAVVGAGKGSSSSDSQGSQTGSRARLYFQLSLCVAVPAAAWWAWHRHNAVKGERLLGKPESELRRLIADVEKLGPGRSSLCIARSDLALVLLESGRLEEAHREVSAALAANQAAQGDAHYLTRRCIVIRDMIASRAAESGAKLPAATDSSAAASAVAVPPAAAPVAGAAAAPVAADKSSSAVPAAAAVPEYTGWRALFVKALTPIFGPPRPPTAAA